MEAGRGRLIALMQLEGGKTLDDALAERARGGGLLPLLCGRGAAQPGAAADARADRRVQSAHHRGRGVFVCISPWNFPLAIFLGQVTAALAANAVRAAAEQTPLIARGAVRSLHQAGVPQSALHLVLGDGKVGAALTDPRVAGVAFTGSTEVGHAINRALAATDGSIVPLIAETGGINAMIADATALPERDRRRPPLRSVLPAALLGVAASAYRKTSLTA